jgi:hypothetical protein
LQRSVKKEVCPSRDRVKCVIRRGILKPEFSIETPGIPDSQVCRQKALRSRLRKFSTSSNAPTVHSLSRVEESTQTRPARLCHRLFSSGHRLKPDMGMGGSEQPPIVSRGFGAVRPRSPPSRPWRAIEKDVLSVESPR